MELISYAQNYEDIRLWRAFRDVENGRYLDIGTQDPNHDSVSRLFYDLGWRGVHVEATAHYAAAMREARPDEQVIEAAVSSSPLPLRFFEIPHTGLSTGVPEIAKFHEKAGWAHRELLVPTITLASLLDHMGAGPIHWLKIDVEGMEADVIASWGDHPARPLALVIEATKPSTQEPTHQSWHAKVTERGYREVLFDGLSRYFIHESEVYRGEALALSPNVFDGFQIMRSHFSAIRLIAENDRAISTLRAEVQAHAEHLAVANAAAADASAQHQAALQRAGELDARLAAEIEVHAQALAQAHAAAAEASAQLDAALQRADALESQLATDAAIQAARLADAQATAADALTRLDEAVRKTATLEQELAERSVAHAAALAEAAAAAAELSASLEVANARATSLEQHVQEQARLHAAGLAMAEERTSIAQRALLETQRHLSAIQADHMALGRLAGRLEGQLEVQAQWSEKIIAEAAARQDELRDRLRRADEELVALRGGVADLHAQLADQIARKEAAAAEAAAVHRNLEASLFAARDDAHQLNVQAGALTERLAAASQQRDEFATRVQELSHDRAELAGELQAAMNGAAEREFALRLEIDNLQASIAMGEKKIIEAEELLATMPDPMSGISGLRRALVRRLLGATKLSAMADHQVAAAGWLPDKPQLSYRAPASDNHGALDCAGHERHGHGEAMGASMSTVERPITSVTQLLAPSDRAFIHAAYWSVLGRGPDPEGEAYYLARLRAGAHKLAILKQMRHSAEGRAFVPAVAGLDRAISRHLWANRRLIGPAVRFFTGEEGNSAIDRRLRIVANEIGRLRTTQVDLAAEFGGFSARLSEMNHNLATWAAAQSATVMHQAAACQSGAERAQGHADHEQAPPSFPLDYHAHDHEQSMPLSGGKDHRDPDQGAAKIPLAGMKIDKLVSEYFSRH